MFDSEFAEADDAMVVAAIEENTRAEAVAGAKRLAAIAELARRRVDDGDLRVFDGWDSAAAEVAAAMTVGHRRASGQMHIAIALRDRLPRVAALHLAGTLSSRIVAAITWRTQLVQDSAGLALIDAAIAKAAAQWGPLSENKLNQAIDAWVYRFDPAALRRSENTTRDRDFCVGDNDDPAETTSVWGRLRTTDAAALKRRLADMLAGVCADDPRSAGERRSDAAGAILNGSFTLACQCGSPACPTADARPSSNVVIRVLADPSALTAAVASGDAAPAEQPPAPAPGDAESPQQPPHPAAVPPPAFIIGEGIVPTPLLAQLIRGGAKVRTITMPSAEGERQHRPSAELAEFVRMRDLFCRAPGCDVPADRCDIDHTRPWPHGPTHASNLKCLCRTNHLAKTFDGWHDVQLPDGTVIWTSPSGRTYITKPGSRLFFETWDTTTADIPPPIVEPASGDRGLMMPKRRRTRAAELAARIKAERARNQQAAPF